MSSIDETPTVRGDDSVPADTDGAGGLESRVLLARARARLLGSEDEPVHIGRYRILDRVGTGGMGVVYLGVDDALDRRVAIKILRHDLAPGTAGRSLLLREAQATAKLSHPNVVHVYEVGHESDQVYMAMEYIEGDTLRRWLDTAQRSVAEIVQVYCGAGEALAAAHAAGLVHRDFKPDNVLLGRDGRPRVVDFGLARPEDVTTTQERVIGISRANDLATTATIAGTPAYMAPETHRGGGADSRSDQFAFCVALFEALFGRRPFPGGTVTELATSIAKAEPVAVDLTARAVPRALHAVVLRGLAREPGDRHASMTALVAEIRRVTAPIGRKRVGAIVAVGAAGLALVAASRITPDEAPPTTAAPRETAAQIDAPTTDPIVAASDLPTPVPTPLPGDATGVTVHRLANGLTIYLAHRPLEPVVTAHIAVRAGVDDVPEAEQGMAALVLDALLQGGENLGTTDAALEKPLLALEHGLLAAYAETDDPATRGAIEKQLDAAGQSARSLRIPYEAATVGNELGLRRQTVLGARGATISADVPAHRIGAWLELVAEMMQRPAFRDFTATAAQRLELIRWVNRDSLGGYAAVHALAPVIGRRYDPALAAEVVRELPLQRAIDYYRTWFRPNNTAIILVGDLTAAGVLPLVERHFGAWEPAPIPSSTFTRGTMPAARTVKSIASGAASVIELTWAMPTDPAERRAAHALGHALGGLEGIASIAFGKRVPTDVNARVTPDLVTVDLSTQPRDDHAALERSLLATLRDVAEDRLPETTWARVIARAELESQRWARSRRNLAIAIEDAYLAGDEWADAAARLSNKPTRADIVAGAKAVLAQPLVVVDQRAGDPWTLDIEPIPTAPLQLVLERRSAWARSILDAKSTPAEPRFLVAGSHYDITPHGAGRVITTKHDGPLFHLSWIVPIGASTDPWACDAVRAKLRRFDVAGVDADSLCTTDDTRITMIGPAERFEVLWPELLRFIADAEIPEAELRAHVEDALQYREYERADALWSTEAVHLWALRGEHGIDAMLPDDATLKRRGVAEITRSLASLGTWAPDVLYTGPNPERLRAVLPPPVDRAGPPAVGFVLREQTEPTIVLLHAPDRPQAEVRVLVPQRSREPKAELAAQLYEFVGEQGFTPSEALVRQEVQPWTPPDGGGPILHGVGYQCAPKDLDAAIVAGLAFLQRRPDRKGFEVARARVEADFRGARVPAQQIPLHVHRWGRAETQDPRVAQWLALPGMSFEVFDAYVADVARAVPVISVIADIDAIDMTALRRHGRVIQVELDEILHDARQAELDVLGMPMIFTDMD